MVKILNDRAVPWLLAIIAWGACTIQAGAQVTQITSSLSGGGGWSSNTVLTTVMQICPPCPIGFAASAGNLAFSGFLETFLLATNLDTNGNGIPDENDPDNDGDGLWDDVELGGNSFNPTTATDPQLADSDGDGMKDGQESVAGTNPKDANSRLWMYEPVRRTNQVILKWTSRKDLRYALLEGNTVTGLLANPSVLSTVTAVNGTAPWYEGQTSYTNDTAVEKSLYRVKVVQP